MKILYIILYLSFLLTSSFSDSNKRIHNFKEIYTITAKPTISKKRILKAIKYAELCSLTDKTNKQIKARYPHAIIHTTKINEVKFFILIDNQHQTQTIAIRGSTTLKNWIQDAKFFKVQDKWARNIQVHKGFYQTTRELYSKANKYLNPKYKTIITGHSLGGGVAILLGLYLEHFNFKKLDIITYGQPRITNKNGAVILRNLRLERIVSQLDLVPSLPPKFLGFRHFGNSLILTGGYLLRDYKTVESGEKDSKETLEIWDKLNNNIKVSKTDFQSHRIANYIKSLYNALEY
ncbi:MAG: hypothetical protein COB02_06435 [Candidatus Cloacimonadota bacterium]|nr:MAG: hypothetical protein COB02_06435 [Candidatus Cloacimonadota bacterium]